MPLPSGTLVVACAGAGKTTRLVRDAAAAVGGRVAVVTYTNNNLRELRKRFEEVGSCVPRHVQLMTWFGFLLRECARPYQHALYSDARIRALHFVAGRSSRYSNETNVRQHYVSGTDQLYSDKVGKFALRCDEDTGGAVVRRLRSAYAQLYIDEWQDLASWDWDIVERLLRAGMPMTMVGDPRQSVLSTNMAQRNQRYRRAGVMGLVEQWEEQGMCTIELMNESRRCCESICRFANRMWPDLEPMTSLVQSVDEHEGVFLVAEDHVEEYMAEYRPQVLRYQRRTAAPGYEAEGMNFGAAKGLQWDRALIVPTGPIKRGLRNGDLSDLRAKEKLHVAVTRARHSVAFVFNGESPIVQQRWP